MDAKPAAPAKPLPYDAGRRRPYLPGRIASSIVALAIVALIALRLFDPIGDEAALNVATFACLMLAGVTLLAWFVFASGYPRVLRIAMVATLLFGGAIFLSLYQIDRVSGTLIPEWRSRFAPPRDAVLDSAEAVASDEPVDLSEVTEHDFPQFLGPDRNQVIKTVQLERDWQAHPPKLLWRQPIGAGWSSFVAANGFAVTLEQRGDQELVTCYEVRTGKLRWTHVEEGRHETVLGGAGPRSTPTIHAGCVYVTTTFGKLLCLAGATGDVIWSVDLLEKFGTDAATDASEIAWGRANSPLIVDELVVVPAGGKPGKAVSLAAFQLGDGKPAWQAGETQISYSSPSLATLAGIRQILSVNESNVTAHDPENGRVLWSWDYPGDSGGNASASQAVTPGGNAVLISKGYGVGSQLLNIEKQGDGGLAPKLEWDNHRVLKTKFTNVSVVGPYAYALSDGILECVKVADGEQVWKGKRYGQGQILIVGDVILVTVEMKGDVAMVEASPKAYKELGRLDAIDGQMWNNLCLYGNLLLVRNAEEAACYELPLRE